MPEIYLGLRIDVDTYRGTKEGVPNLQKILSSNQLLASFFFCVGPDNMGRHIIKLLKSGFLKKMLRSNAPNLYGWDILFKGTILPGPVIGKKCSDIIRAIALDDHEIGLHAWDHYQWQAHILKMSREQIFHTLQKGIESLESITGKAPTCSAAPGWICNNDVLEVKDKFSFTYNSDTRGSHIFFPIVKDKVLTRPQIPVTLPTYDEIIGCHGMNQANYNEYLLSLIKPGQLNVLTIHAEAEGIHCLDLFEAFIKKVLDRKIHIIPLGSFLKKFSSIDVSKVIEKEITGRHGKVAVQATGIEDIN
jgi:undecaprenyl phosphate-alpha-L-ara4FN deformylase